MAISDVITALNGRGIASADVAIVNATPSNTGGWNVSDQVAWLGSPLAPPVFTFSTTQPSGLTASQIGIATISRGGITGAYTAENVLAYDGTHVLLGQGTFSGGQYSIYYYISATSLQPPVSGYPFSLGTTGSFTAPPAVTPPCFAAGTRIRTDRGDVAVESIAAGDQVHTLNGIRPVMWVGRCRVDIAAHPRPETVRPVRIRRDAVRAGAPSRDLLVSPDHAIHVEGKLIPARMLVNGGSIVEEHAARSVEYVHVELDGHAILFADGLTAESYLDTGNRATFENGTASMLHADFDEAISGARADASCEPFVVAPDVVEPIWARLAARAEALGWALPHAETTDDAALRVLVGARTIEPATVAADLVTFVLPGGAAEICLTSRAGTPASARPWLDDRRTLGVAVCRMVLRDGATVSEIAIDGPQLGSGWWTLETNGAATWRWTDGAARLDLPQGGSDVRTLEIHLGGRQTYLADAPDREVAAA